MRFPILLPSEETTELTEIRNNQSEILLISTSGLKNLISTNLTKYTHRYIFVHTGIQLYKHECSQGSFNEIKGNYLQYLFRQV